MAPTRESRRTVFRQIAQQSNVDWPAYESTPLFNRSSLAAVESDIRVVAETWFQQEAHETIKPFVSRFPLAYVQFDAHDCYAGSTSYEMATLFRLFLLKELHGWDHETALVEYLTQHPDLCNRRNLESVLTNQSCGAAGTIASLLISKTPSRQPLELSSSKRRMRASRSREIQTDRTADTVTRVQNQIPMTRPY